MFKEDELRGFLSRYDEALQVRSEAHRTSNDLVNQDRWYRSKLRDALKTRRAEKNGAYMTKGEMVKLMQWKLARGKWRPSLEAYVAAHEERDIRGATKDLFAAIDKESEKSSKEPVSRQILKKITCLKGIGPATASAILAAYEPTRFPFLSDEAFVGVGKLGIKAEHTEAALDRFHARMHERVAAEGWSDVDELERACYAAGVIKKYGAASEGQEGREKGKKKDAEELIESVKHSATAEQRTAKYARPDAATAHGGDEVPTDSAGNKESASSSKGKGRAQKEKQETKKEQAEESNKPSSSSKKRKTTDDSKATQGERKSARLASK
ncbi:unnamed protein product [Tilletia controversa]|nr:hypothetical protein CF335_g3992 [Tilletia laevis]CAD6981955.1 unnamed protein product [Tilletia controversa]